jgi:hypothetical protein
MSFIQAYHHYSHLIQGVEVEIANFISVNFTKMETTPLWPHEIIFGGSNGWTTETIDENAR